MRGLGAMSEVEFKDVHSILEEVHEHARKGIDLITQSTTGALKMEARLKLYHDTFIESANKLDFTVLRFK
jgi:hypothetical protein